MKHFTVLTEKANCKKQRRGYKQFDYRSLAQLQAKSYTNPSSPTQCISGDIFKCYLDFEKKKSQECLWKLDMCGIALNVLVNKLLKKNPKQKNTLSPFKEQWQYFSLICKENTIIITSYASKWRTKMGVNIWIKFPVKT